MTEARVATRDSYPIADVACDWEALDLDLSFDASDFDRVRRGFIPEAKFDTWFIYYEEPWLHVNRARPGACFARLRFVRIGDRQVAAEIWLRKGAHLGYQQTWDHADKVRALSWAFQQAFSTWPRPLDA